MAKKTYKELRAEQEALHVAKIEAALEYNRTELPTQVLFALAQADGLGLNYKVEPVGDTNAVCVTIMAGPLDLTYSDEACVDVYAVPSEYGYTDMRQVENLFELNNRVVRHKEEKKRLEAVKVEALAKLTDEEKTVLGLVPKKERW